MWQIDAVANAVVAAAVPTGQPVRRVVIADDAATIRVPHRQVLESSMAFAVVGEAGDGEEAVRLAAEQQPDLIVLDLAMPVLDGLQAIPRIWRLSPSTRIAVLSVFNSDRMAACALEEGGGRLPGEAGPARRTARPAAKGVPCAHRDGRDGRRAGGEPNRSPEELARQSRERFRLAFEHAPIGIALESLDGRLVMVNDALCRISAYSQDELTNAPGDSLSHPDDVAAARSQRETLLAGRTAFASGEHRYLRPDGRPMDDGEPVPGARRAGRPPGVRHPGRRHLRTEAGRGAAAGGRRRQRALRPRAGPVQRRAGPLRVGRRPRARPCRSITGFASLLGRMYGPVLDDQGRESVDWIVKSAARMDALIDDLLAYTRVGPSARVDTPVDLGAVMGDVAVALGTTAAQLTWGDLPEVAGDPVQLNQLLLNLVSNGCKFVADGTQVHVSAERRAEGWCVTVADNGIGIDPERREQVFEMFKRLNGRDTYDGTGIGLAICKRIVEGRGGRIWVVAEPEGGSRFRFTVPDRIGPDRIPDRPAASAPSAPDRAEAAAPEDGLLLRLAKDLRYATLTRRPGERLLRPPRRPARRSGRGRRHAGGRVPPQAGHIRPHDTVERTGDTQFAVVCTSMSRPQDVVAVRARLSTAAANAGAAVFIGVASSSGDDEPGDLLRRAVYGRTGSRRPRPS